MIHRTRNWRTTPGTVCLSLYTESTLFMRHFSHCTIFALSVFLAQLGYAHAADVLIKTDNSRALKEVSVVQTQNEQKDLESDTSDLSWLYRLENERLARQKSLEAGEVDLESYLGDASDVQSNDLVITLLRLENQARQTRYNLESCPAPRIPARSENRSSETEVVNSVNQWISCYNQQTSSIKQLYEQSRRISSELETVLSETESKQLRSHLDRIYREYTLEGKQKVADLNSKYALWKKNSDDFKKRFLYQANLFEQH